MNAKTPAEIQMELLRRLKEEASQKPGKPVRAAAPSSPRPAGFEVDQAPKRTRKAAARTKTAALPMGKAAWEKLRAKFSDPGQAFRPGKGLGDLAAQLLLELPREAGKWSEAERQNLAEMVRQWCDNRYRK